MLPVIVYYKLSYFIKSYCILCYFNKLLVESILDIVTHTLKFDNKFIYIKLITILL